VLFVVYSICMFSVVVVSFFSFFFFFFSSRRRHTRSVSAFLLNRSSDLPRRNGERRRAPTASISKESPAITGVVEMVIRRPIRSEERFSRNAETEIVCRLLLEKKKKQSRNQER